MNKKMQAPSWLSQPGEPAPVAAEAPPPAQPTAAQTAPAPQANLPRLTTIDRDQRFVVLLDERLPRQDTVLMQVSVPKDIHQRLKYESLGSMNQVLMGLVRYALNDLDTKGKTLQISR